eukprot:TRINITY_DN8942_c0_g1_i3.p1 TRINITY_DN8942_c0_g1~~TRINITY_DN8942_c0_g1_i3.p1  ORF type:complete len:523 (-),score=73.80 TRINITY_DN8942_c0_g1_i3:193-1611(-)
MEKTLLALARLKTTPGQLSVIESIRNITENSMKPTILSQLQAASDRLAAANASFTTCSDTLSTSLAGAQALKSELAGLKTGFENCVSNMLQDTSGQYDGNPYVSGPSGCVTGGLAACSAAAAATAQTLTSGANTSGVSLGQSGITWTSTFCDTKYCPLTEAACALANIWCTSFRATDSALTIDSPSAGSTSPLNTYSSASTEYCHSATPSEIADPSGEAYFERMAQYWRGWVAKWETANCNCITYSAWCRRNITQCPGAEPTGLICPSPESELTASNLDTSICTATTVTTSSPLPVSVPCKQEQDSLDDKACTYGKNKSSACTVYNFCYTSANQSMNSAYGEVCGSQGLLDQLKTQYYGVLRIECILDAISQNTTGQRSAAVTSCQSKTIADYNLSVIYIAACSDMLSAWPTDAAKDNADCIAASNFSSDADVSGSMPYADKYYVNIANPQTCVSECCTALPSNYVPISTVV